MDTSTLCVLGIDPGLTGALALIRPGEVLSVHDMPVETGAAKRNRVSGALLAHLMRSIQEQHGPFVAVLEDVSAMPNQGVTGVFSFGRSRGVLEGCLAAFGIEVCAYTPSFWKRRLGLLGRPKGYSRTRAMELYPGAANWLGRAKDDGRAEAILLAHLRLVGGG